MLGLGVSIADFGSVVPGSNPGRAQDFLAFFCIFHLCLHFIEKVWPIAFKIILKRFILIKKIEKKGEKRKIDNADKRDQTQNLFLPLPAPYHWAKVLAIVNTELISNKIHLRGVWSSHTPMLNCMENTLC